MRIKSVVGRAGGAIGAQATQALASFVLMAFAARSLDIENLARFGVLYGAIILMTALSTGFVGDSLTVLDRKNASIKSALQNWAGIIVLAVAVVAAGISVITGFLTPVESALFAVASIMYMVEDLLRRWLMAELRFPQIMAVDLTSLVFSLLSLGAWAILLDLQTASDASHPRSLTLSAFLLALGVGQCTAAITAVGLLHRSDRQPSTAQAQMRTVFNYGFWRALQQVLRPTMQTLTRVLLIALVGLVAAGQLELGRLYAAPAMLLIGGISSYLFASFAKQKTVAGSKLIAQADRGVLLLLALTIPGAALMVLLLPWLGPLLLGSAPGFLEAAGWLAYGISVATVTPYGVLGAVIAKPGRIFVIRAIDSCVSLATVALVLVCGLDPALAAFAMVPGSILGGLAIRVMLARHRPPDPASLASRGRLDPHKTRATIL